MANVVIYTSAVCPYCVAAKNFLAQRGVSYSEIRVDLEPAKRAEMVDLAKRTSVPQIFIDGAHIGGFDDMVALDRRGGLMPMLESQA